MSAADQRTVAQRPPQHRSRLRLCGARLAGALACLLICAALNGQKAKPTDYEVKAAYLYNFGKFVEWPENSANGKEQFFEICVLGRDPFGAALDTTLVGQSIGGRKVVAKRIAKPEDAIACQVLFISTSEQEQLKSILAVLARASVLTVSDMPEFSLHGGMIQFISYGDRVRFEVNLTNAGNAGLTLSSELLKVAMTVRKNQSSGD